jgi:hypothetical protein
LRRAARTTPFISSAKKGSRVHLDEANDDGSAVLNTMDTNKPSGGGLPVAPELGTSPILTAMKSPHLEVEVRNEKQLGLIGLFGRSLRTSGQASSMVESESILFLRKASEVANPIANVIESY